MGKDLLLVGSIPCDTAEEVFRLIGPNLGRWLPFIPDGEVGERLYWVNHVAYRVLHGHPDIETLSRPMTKNGIENWHKGPLDTGQWSFKLKQGVKRVQFGEPGWRLGYARDAINSYFIFKTLRTEGVIPSEVKFQVCLPLTASAIHRWLADEGDYPAIRDGFTESMYYEVATIFNKIPHEDLAIQWDCAIEDTIIEEALTKAGGHTDAVNKLIEELFKPAGELSSHIPETVELGYHACYGTAGGWPRREPDNLNGVVLLCNAAIRSTGRKVDFIHIPTVASQSSNYFDALKDLEAQQARVYVGLIHALHDSNGMRKQMEGIKKYLPNFGIAAPCGFGRGPGKMSSQKGLARANDYMEGLIEDHIKAVGQLHSILDD